MEGVRNMLADEIWFYIGERVDNDNILPDEDEIYTRFQKSFDIHGANPDVIEKTVQSYVSVSELTGVEIRWEGELHEVSHRRTLQEPEIPSKTA
jgi:hypothetical protein